MSGRCFIQGTLYPRSVSPGGVLSVCESAHIYPSINICTHTSSRSAKRTNRHSKAREKSCNFRQTRVIWIEFQPGNSFDAHIRLLCFRLRLIETIFAVQTMSCRRRLGKYLFTKYRNCFGLPRRRGYGAVPHYFGSNL